VRGHSRQKLELQCGDVDAAGEELSAGIEAGGLDELEILVDCWCRSLAHTVTDDIEGATVDVEQLLGDFEIPARGQPLTGFHSDVSPEASLPVGKLLAL